MIVTSEYIYNNPELNELNDIIEKTRLEHDQRYGIDYGSVVKIKFDVKFFGKIKNKTKTFTTKFIEKSIIASQNKYEMIKIDKLSISIDGKIY